MKTGLLTICTLLLLLLVACGNEAKDVGSNQPEAKAPSEPSGSGQPAAEKNSYSGFDIAGIYIGMSPEEVEAQLKAYDDELKIQSSTQYFNYSALGKRYKTEPHLAAIIGTAPGGRLNIEVGFSFPPGPPKVISVKRTHRQTTAPSTEADYLASLTEKYGKPEQDYFDQALKARVLEWRMPGGAEKCMAGMGGSAGNPVLKNMQQDGQRLDSPTPEYASNCKGIMMYTLNGDPVTHANGKLMDVAAAANAEFATEAWIQQLVEEKSRAGSEKPKL